ncbi:pentapeptide repeat-containing protein [Nonomuraea sp. MTCD27]|uniref:pentapeptide repeat-containing protein n=1 Tax=Nonomuraea sp. MTCD27 TaxID=1676747 RepID=UPI0035BEB8C4
MAASSFGGATFIGATGFGVVTFTGDAYFGGATFTGDANFTEATITGSATFGGAMGLDSAELGDVRVAPAAADVMRVWPPGWRVAAGADGWQTLRLAAIPEGETAAGSGAPEGSPEPEGLT